MTLASRTIGQYESYGRLASPSLLYSQLSSRFLKTHINKRVEVGRCHDGLLLNVNRLQNNSSEASTELDDNCNENSNSLRIRCSVRRRASHDKALKSRISNVISEIYRGTRQREKRRPTSCQSTYLSLPTNPLCFIVLSRSICFFCNLSR